MPGVESLLEMKLLDELWMEGIEGAETNMNRHRAKRAAPTITGFGQDLGGSVCSFPS